nr:MAG TPA: hypothetical protein [Caudoviricetes sp.]
MNGYSRLVMSLKMIAILEEGGHFLLLILRISSAKAMRRRQN